MVWEQFGLMFVKILPYIPNLIFILGLIIGAFILAHILNRSYDRISRKLKARFDITISKWVLKLVLYSIIGMLIILNIPGINERIITTIGYIFAGIIAFSSSTIIANGMSGLMIRLMNMFKPGDVVTIGKHFGTIAELKLLHTLLETAEKQIITIPNSLIMKGPVINYSEDHPLLKIEVSLGYDLNRIEAEHLLLISAKNAGLKKVFVTVTDLGNYAITYVVNGILSDERDKPFVESNVRKNIVDQFHLAGKEILSPMYISHRVAGKKVFPKIKRNTKRILTEKEQAERKLAGVLEYTIFQEADKLIKRGKRLRRLL